MITFDFVSGDDFRTSLEADYQELNSCMQAQAWKAVHVLAGSIIETVLIDYLIASKYQNRTSEEILKMDLSSAISACRNEKVLTQKTADLSSVVRQYRNLIHPGRVVRLEEKVDENSATIAQKLVEIIVWEISKRKNETFGYTAEQVLRKIENDSSVIAILPHVLKNVSDIEIRRLLLKLLPQRYFELISQDTEDQGEYYWAGNATTSIEKCFRIALDVAPDEVKKEVVKKFVSILKEENEYMVMTYEVVFFRVSDFVYLSSDETMLIKQHLLARLLKEVTVPLLVAMKGIGAFLVSDEIYEFTNSIIKTILYKKDRELKNTAREFMVNEYSAMNEKCQNMVKNSFTCWINFLKNKEQVELAEIVEEIRSSVEFEDEIPF